LERRRCAYAFLVHAVRGMPELSQPTGSRKRVRRHSHGDVARRVGQKRTPRRSSGASLKGGQTGNRPKKCGADLAGSARCSIT
jgi:hypothetical protein